MGKRSSLLNVIYMSVLFVLLLVNDKSSMGLIQKLAIYVFILILGFVSKEIFSAMLSLKQQFHSDSVLDTNNIALLYKAMYLFSNILFIFNLVLCVLNLLNDVLLVKGISEESLVIWMALPIWLNVKRGILDSQKIIEETTEN